MNVEQRVARVHARLEELEALVGLSDNPNQVDLDLLPQEPVKVDEEGSAVDGVVEAVRSAIQQAADAGVDVSEVQPLVVTSLDQLQKLPREAKEQAVAQARVLLDVLGEAA